MRYIFYSLIFALCTLIFACRINPNVQGKGEPILQGVWSQDTIQYEDQLLEYTRHKFTFTCDSFYVTMITKDKARQNQDSCYRSGTWTEYAKGTYAMSKDSLYLFGTFTKDNFKQKISGCYRIGEYNPIFIVKSHTPSKLIFQDQHMNIDLDLKQKISCVPKPL